MKLKVDEAKIIGEQYDSIFESFKLEDNDNVISIDSIVEDDEIETIVMVSSIYEDDNDEKFSEITTFSTSNIYPSDLKVSIINLTLEDTLRITRHIISEMDFHDSELSRIDGMLDEIDYLTNVNSELDRISTGKDNKCLCSECKNGC